MAKQTINIGTTANDGTGDPLRTAFDKINDNFTELYSDDAGDVGSITGGTGITASSSTGDVTLSITNDGVGHDQLAARYTEIQDIATTSGTIALDASLYAAFNLTGALGTATLDVQNIKTGQVIDIILSGSLASAVLTLSASTFTTVAINKVGSTSLDTAATNILQVLCVDDTDGDAILTWAVASYATGTTV
jgi:hypothetical protein